MFNIIIFGPPGSGKGTQSIKLAEKYSLTHISTGDIFRSEIKAKSELGLRVQGIIEAGDLVPDELLVDLLRSAMDKHHGTAGFLFDGFPRTTQQANDLDVLLHESNTDVGVVLALDVHDDELMERLLNRARIEGRKDDTAEVIANRLKVYHSQTKPLMDLYDGKGKLEGVQGVGSIDDIFESLCVVVDKRI
jgi:adenylate kinase